MLIHWTTALIAVTLLAGCARESEPKNYRIAHPTTKNSAEPDEADLVSAVSAGGSTGPVRLKFRIAEPPRVGQPLRVELVLAQTPGLDISHLMVSLQPSDGLLLESDRNIQFEGPPPGATHRMVVNLRAQQQGLLNLNATVLVDGENTSLTRSFSIPLIVEP